MLFAKEIEEATGQKLHLHSSKEAKRSQETIIVI